MTTPGALTRPRGLEWREAFVAGGWCAHTRAAFTGRQALLLIAAPFLGFFSSLVAAFFGGTSAAIGLGVGITLALLARALRKRPVTVLRVDARGVALDHSAPIGPLVDIERFEMVNSVPTVGAPSNRIFIHRRKGAHVALDLPENDPLYLRFIAQRLDEATKELGDPGYRG